MTISVPQPPVRGWLPWVVVLVACVAAAEPRPVTWLVNDATPQFILAGPEKGRGSVQAVLDYLEVRMPEYTPRLVVTNVQRTVELLQTDEAVAGIGMVKTPDREKKMLFSEPFTVALPPGLLVRKTDLASLAPFLGADDRLDLDGVLFSGNLSVGVAAGRSYGPQVDRVLARYQGKDVVQTRFAESGLMAGLVQMLTSGRIGSVLVYRSEVRYAIRDEATLGLLTVLPVLQAADPVTIHVVAPDTPWGREFLSRVNPLLVAARKTPEFRALAERWSDETSRAAATKVIQGWP